jgi:putative phosphoesterase
MSDTVTLGLISDTHMPARWKQLPKTVFDALAGVDLVLHAGDLGDLWVLDELSRIAPVVAVHGNDETAETQAALPYLLTVAAAGRRVVLTHSHFPDRTEEVESRKIDDWTPKLARWAGIAKAHGADIMVLGHSHVPMVKQFDGVWLVNPGAIASGGWGSRQLVQTVARLTLEREGDPQVKFQ